MRIHDTLLGLFFMALGAIVFGYTGTFPEFPGQKYGPSLFPRVIAAGIFVCGLIIATRGWRSGRPWLEVDKALRSGWLLFLAMPVAIVFYLLVAERLGFLPTAALIVGALAMAFGVRAFPAVALALATAGLVQWFFGTLMRVPLPRGWFMQILVGG